MKPSCPIQGKDTQITLYHRGRQIFLIPVQDAKIWELCTGCWWLSGITLNTVMVWLLKQGFAAFARVELTHSWAKQEKKKGLEHFVFSVWLYCNQLSYFCYTSSFIQQSYTLVKNWQSKRRIHNSWEYLSTRVVFPFPFMCILLLFKTLITSNWSHMLKISSCLSLLLLRTSRFCNSFRFSCVKGDPFGI